MAEIRQDLVVWFENLRNTDVPIAGGKNASLGEMIYAGIPVPPGFAITAFSYKKFIDETGISKRIYEIINETVTNPSEPALYEVASKKIRQLIESTPMPKEIADAVRASYEGLCKRLNVNDVFVAVRSSATAEDLPDASFAGQQETFLNVRGINEVLVSTVKCWSSLFTPRAIFYRTEKGFAHEKVLISVGVQKMINSRAAGVMFTINPVTGENTQIVIEGNHGLGEAVVSGAVTPDDFVVEKSSNKIIERRLAKKTIQYIRDPNTGKTIHAEVPADKQMQPCISDEEVLKLTELAKRIERHYGKAMDIEWTIDRDIPAPSNMFIVQARPETVWGSKGAETPAKVAAEGVKPAEAKIVVKGIAAGRRDYGVGVAKVVMSTEEASRVMEKGNILVTEMTNPDFVPFMKLAGAIVTDKGGVTCHAAIVSRELGIPCVVGTDNATKLMVTGKSYTVDAKNGVIYEGLLSSLAEKPTPTAGAVAAVFGGVVESAPVTATKIYMNLGVPEKVEEYKNLPFEGIGLMRIEFILASHIGDHPLYLMESGRSQEFVDKLADGIGTVARAIQPRPVVVRFSDFKTNEYRALKGGDKYEIHEDNPMLGWRGCSRYISHWYEKAFRLECQAINKCRKEWGLKNIWVMLPVVRTLWETRTVLEIMREEGLERSKDFKVWFMAETPSIAILADEFSKLCDGFSIGSNDMTQGILMIDRDSERLGQMGYFDERDPAVKRILAHLIEVAHENGCTVSICGEGPSNLPDFAEFLVRIGIDSISVNNDAVVATRKHIASVEKKMVLERLAELKAQADGCPLKRPKPDWEW